MKYLINENEPLTVAKLEKIIKNFQTTELPQLIKRHNYYLGKHAILNRQPTDEGKPDNRIVCNFISNIVDTYEGYCTGIPITYTNTDDQLMEVLKNNDVEDADSDWFRNGLIYGKGYEICFLDENGQQHFKQLDAKECIPIYDNTLMSNLKYLVRWYLDSNIEKDTPDYIVEVYDDVFVTTYKCNNNLTGFQLINQTQHYFNSIPVSIFYLNDEEMGCCDGVFTLQDSYNSLMSDSVNDWDSFCDAYMIIKGCQADEDDLVAMKKNRVLMLDADCSAEYLTKNTTNTEIQNLMTNTETKIREISACPNFSNETFATSSGIAIRYRLMAMENKASGYINNFKKAILNRIGLLNGILGLLGVDNMEEVNLEFHRNIPVDNTETVNMVNSLRGLVSTQTLLSLLPFIKNPEEELKLVKEEQKEQQSYFSYNFTETEEELTNE